MPVYDVSSKEDAVAELLTAGLSADALEQKCLRQIFNVSLEYERLVQQVALWERAISSSLNSVEEICIEIVHDTTLGKIRNKSNS